MQLRTYFLSLCALLLLGACTANPDYEEMKMKTGGDNVGFKTILNMDLNTDKYSAWLSKDYHALSTFEYKDMYDYDDGDYFAAKSLAASKGQSVMPTKVSDRNVDIRFQEEILSAYNNVMDAYAQKKDVYYPKEMARLQVSYDCWLEQVEEGHQINHILDCKDMFYDALANMKGLATTVVVYFENDSFVIIPDEAQKLNAVISNFRVARKQIIIEGHTDSVGTNSYNQGLSERRAKTVSDYVGPRLIEFDRDLVLDSTITTIGYGETQLAIPTGDGVSEPRNRRAIVHFK